MKTNAILFLLLSGIVTSCGWVSAAKETADGYQQMTQAARNVSEGTEAINKKVEERRAKGDTLALPFRTLAQFMPAEVAGYETDGEPSGQTTNNEGFSFSSYELKYKKGEESEVKIELADYNASAALLSMATVAMSSGMEIENENQITKSWATGMESVRGYEEFYKKGKQAKVTISVGERFLVQVSATNQENTDFVKEVAQSLKLKELTQY
ncbi:hypothetical protein [Siphonobacter sp.]|uniref:hypothetical protein n=1 Tax=Siphonobacter sp. TaxID=1869184 RepID=UPI003B3AA39F